MNPRNTKPYWGFLLCNIFLVFVVCMMWVMPSFTSLARTRERVRLQESRLDVYRRGLEHNAVGAAYRGDTQRITPFPYREFTSALAEITNKGTALGLRETVLSTSEPITYDVNGRADRVFFEMRVSAIYEGDAAALAAFIHNLEEVRIQTLQITLGETASAMRLSFSLFGISG
jgi:hypothetical protein